ncbi:MAG: hypothetical protein A2Y62_14405 [Candidatus Fischerbacteria bacterium RBG_13_37_8]|uniref:Fibronectin type-III domain-containing protein n=1 Tax=Candidatus Fischerbacteria bacterium RBG_13_37_8 TaxID=1817863 RepID=A0A1F5VNS4_9BACT|nr:MAG: hypothetical protein A2Y62_14405 [Candidatus Fischerbacteria bacterium RBG_13_37_8]
MPASVTVEATSPNQITVSWSPDSSATGYNVYRKYYHCGHIKEELVAENIGTAYYVDNIVSGGNTYSYSIAGRGNCESKHSEWVSVIATGTCRLSPCFAGVTAVNNDQAQSCSLTVQWNPAISSCASFPPVTYTIYKSMDQNFTPDPTNQIATCVAETSYVDTDVSNAYQFYYIVRAEDPGNGGTGPCNGGNIDENTYKLVNVPTGGVIYPAFLDNFDNNLNSWNVSANWNRTTKHSYSGIASVHSGNANDQLCDTLTKDAFITFPANSAPKLLFRAVHQIESGNDAGIVEGSTDGTNWAKIELMAPNYPGYTNNYARTCLGSNPQPAFSGNSVKWTDYMADLSAFAGGDFKVRFTYATDSSTANGGWWIDDVKIFAAPGCQNSSPNCSTPPVFAGIKSATGPGSENCRITLSWDAASSTCTVSPNVTYHIYKSINPNFVPSADNMIASCVSETDYIDTNVAYGIQYYYVVRAEDSSSNGNGPCNNGNTDLNIIKKNATPAGLITPVFNDNFESGLGNWYISANWNWTIAQSHSASHSVHSGNVNNQCDTLTLVNFLLPPQNSDPQLTFWTLYSIDNGNDGGIVEISQDGITWNKLDLTPTYPGLATNSCIGANQSCFTGFGMNWIQHSADLSIYENSAIKIRFKYATNDLGSSGGWYIDDVQVLWSESCISEGEPPGAVPDNDNYPGLPLSITKDGANLSLNWDAPGGTCLTQDYGIYRGSLPWSGYNHVPVTCTTCGTTSVVITQGTNSYYYLVVARNAGHEGSYGLDSSNLQRPASPSSCSPQQIGTCN